MQRLKTLSLTISNTSQENNLFSHVELAPPDAILGTRIAYNQDLNNDKINLGVGAYRDDEGNPYVFQIVRKIEVMLLAKHISHVNIGSFRSTWRLMVFLSSSQVLEI